MKGALALVCLLWGMTVAVPIKATETGDTTSTDISETGTKSTVNLTIPDSLNGHTFVAYQIFKGDVSGKILSNAEWGEGVKTETLIGYLVNKKLLNSGDTSAKAAAEAIATYTEGGTNGEKSREVALWVNESKSSGNGIELQAGSNELVPGYYLIVDTTQAPGEGINDFVWNESLLQLTENMTIQKKTETASVEKKVLDSESNHYQDVADHSIGEDVQFQLTSKVPDTTHYSNYTYVFHDTLSNGLTLKENSISVKVGDSTLNSSDFTVTQSTGDECTFHITVPNLKGKDGNDVQINYSATLNNKAYVGIAGSGETPNTNSVYLGYSNHPYDENSFATTPEDKVLVLTYKLVGAKKDTATNEPLENAEFYLLNSNNESGEVYAKTDAGGKLISWTTKKEATVFKSTGKNGEFEIQGLDAGTYYLKEIKAPVGYNIMDNLQPVVVEANKVSEYDFIGSPIQNDQSTNDESSNESVNDAGVKNVTVYNGKGFTMPSTGAFGQTLIYGVGGLLALGGLGIRMARRRHEQD